MTKTKERMQTKASPAKQAPASSEARSHSSNYTNGNVHPRTKTKTKNKKNLKKMQKCCCQKRCKKKQEKFAKGWQTNKDATRGDATRRDQFQWRVRGANAADNAAKKPSQPVRLAAKRPRTRQCSARHPHPHNAGTGTGNATARTCASPDVANCGAVTRGERLTWEAHRLSGRIMSRCHLCHKSVETKR